MFNKKVAIKYVAAKAVEQGKGEPALTDTSLKEDAGRSKVSPPNLQRLKASLLKMIAHTMLLPISVSVDELCQLIDGKLIAMGKEARNVKVFVTNMG